MLAAHPQGAIDVESHQVEAQNPQVMTGSCLLSLSSKPNARGLDRDSYSQSHGDAALFNLLTSHFPEDLASTAAGVAAVSTLKVMYRFRPS